jgi:chaperonin cofactor prefoldin
MGTIEIIGIVIGATATILAGVGYSISQIFKLGKNLGTYSHRFETMEISIVELKDSVKHLDGKVQRLDDRFNLLDGKVQHLDDRFNLLDSKVQHLDDRFNLLDSKVQHLDDRFNLLDGKVQRLDDKVQHLDDKFNHLPCTAHSEDLGKIKTVLLRDPLMAFFFGLRGSPRRLSEYGLKVFADIDGDTFLKENKESLFKCITENKPLTAFDVEQLAGYACVSLSFTPAFNKIKDYIYNASPIDAPNGEKHELTLNNVCFILGIPLRDMYLEEVGIKEESA